MLKKLKRVIVGIDIFSKSNNTLKRALMLARQNKSELYIVHVVDTPWLELPSFLGGKEMSVDVKALKQKIEKKLEIYNKDKEVTYHIFIKEGKVADVLLYESKILKADILVIGKNTKKTKSFLGTSAEKIVHQSSIPVLIVKNTVKKPYQNIVAPTDFQTQSIQGIVFVKKIFPKSNIHAVHSLETIYFMEDSYHLVGRDLSEYNENAKVNAKESMKNLLQDFSLQKGKIIDSDLDNKKALLKYIKNGSYDLTVVGSRSFEGFMTLLGSMSSTVFRKVGTDVLVYVQ